MIRRKLSFVIGSLSLSLWALALPGCQTTPPSDKPKTTVTTGGQPYTGDVIASFDPCVNQVHDLGGALLLYRLANRGKLPARLQDLQEFADPGETLKFTCPATGKPYVYVPGGMEALGENVRIYIYEPDPHNGGRACAYSQPTASAGAETVFAKRVPEAWFNKFAPISPTAPPPAAPPGPPTPPLK